MKRKKSSDAVNIQEDEDFSVHPLYYKPTKGQGLVKKISTSPKRIFIYKADDKKEVNGKYYNP